MDSEVKLPPINYAVLAEFGDRHRIGYNVLCNTVHKALREVPAALARPSAAGDADTHMVARFGLGAISVSSGTRNNEPAVFLHEVSAAGEVGQPVLSDHADTPLRFVMLFPTTEQAKRVAAALVNEAALTGAQP